MKRSKRPSPTPTVESQAKKVKLASPEHEHPTVRDGGDDGWTRVERRKDKKTRKKEVKLDANGPARFMYVNSEIVKRREPVGISDVRDLVLHIAADAPPLHWLRVDNPRSIQKVVVLLIPGLTHEQLSLPPLPTSATSNPHLPLALPEPDESSTSLPFFISTFSHACPTRAPGDVYRMHSVMTEFFSGPITGEEKKRRLQERIALERAGDKDPARYIIPLDDMAENDYPIPSYMAEFFEKPPGWVETPKPADVSLLAEEQAAPKIYALDCEMCLTEDGNELARVCVIDYATTKVVYDQLVKPKKPVLDYLTRWSGITAEALEPVTTTFEEVQEQVMHLLRVTPTPILLGHSLESDLKALKICHPRVIDTALIYNHPRGKPMKPGLAWLARKWLGREIQNRGAGGHDPEEDARACLDLLRKKVQNGQSFGEFKTDFESIFIRMRRSSRSGGPIRSAVVDHGNPSVMHGSKADTSIGCKNDDEVLDGLLGAVPSHQFSFGRFTSLAEASGWITTKSAVETPALEPILPPSTGTTGVEPILHKLNSRLMRLHSALPPRTALIIFTGHSDPRRMSALNARKGAFEQAIRLGIPGTDVATEVKWTAAEGRELEEEAERAKRGLLFLCIKNS